MSVLPEGWTEARLKDVTTPVSSTHPRHEPTRTFRYIDISAVDNSSNAVNHGAIKSFLGSDAPSRARRPIGPGDVIYSNVRTYLKNVALIDHDVADLCSTGFTVLRSNGAVDPKYLFRWVLTDTFLEGIKPHETGTHYPATSDRQVLEQCIPLPPLAEQRRIVERIEALLTRASAIQARIIRADNQIATYRESLVAAMCQPAESWDSSTVGQVASDIRYGTAVKCDYDSAGVPVLRIPNIQKGAIDRSDLKYGRLTERERRKLSLQPGDLLMIRSNGSTSLVGRTAVVTDADQDFAFAGYLIRIRLRRDTVEPGFIHTVLQSRSMRDIIETAARSTSGVHNINSEEIAKLPLALPPLDEQRKITDVTRQFDLHVHRIRRRVAVARRLSEALPQSILVRAFAGELVPTEAEVARREGRSYEPASALLARIRAERPFSRSSSRPRRHRTAASSGPPDSSPRR